MGAGASAPEEPNGCYVCLEADAPGRPLLHSPCRCRTALLHRECFARIGDRCTICKEPFLNTPDVPLEPLGGHVGRVVGGALADSVTLLALVAMAGVLSLMPNHGAVRGAHVLALVAEGAVAGAAVLGVARRLPERVRLPLGVLLAAVVAWLHGTAVLGVLDVLPRWHALETALEVLWLLLVLLRAVVRLAHALATLRVVSERPISVSEV